MGELLGSKTSKWYRQKEEGRNVEWWDYGRVRIEDWKCGSSDGDVCMYVVLYVQ